MTKPKSRKKSFTVVHKSLGEGQLVGLRHGESGAWLADVKFSGTRRTLQLQAEHWETAISDILKLLPHFPPPKPEKATPGITPNDDESDDSTEDSLLDSGDDSEEDGETELELGEEESEVEAEAEEIGVDA
jgi:hypothetical protein